MSQEPNSISSLIAALPLKLEAMRKALWSETRFWFFALCLGIAAGLAAVGFQLAITWLQSAAYGTEKVDYLHSHVAGLAWYWIVLIPTTGGLVVGLLLHFFTPDARVRSVADVISAAALREGRVERKAGIASALASWITLSTGGSAGREGPVVHIAALLSSKLSNWIEADGRDGRDLLGCAVAAAVSASFNAPIAGAIFAMEVILRHYAVHAMAPILVASAAGAVVNRVILGNSVEFDLPFDGSLAFYAELPALMLLGLICGLVAVFLMTSLFWADGWATRQQERLHLPRWLRPTLAGALLGAIAIYFPVVIGVGYETTFAALSGLISWHDAFLFAVIKGVAFVITIAGRMGGGVFSPSLMIGALLGLGFGLVATAIVPNFSGLPSVYALAGMGAVAASVLGAPISTILIVFEMTGDLQAALAVMVAVSLSTALSTRLVERSFFLTQLAKRNIHLAAGPHAYLTTLIPVTKNMQKFETLSEEEQVEAGGQLLAGLYVESDAYLDLAMPLFEQTGARQLPVVIFGADEKAPKIIGVLTHMAALKEFNTALQRASQEAND